MIPERQPAVNDKFFFHILHIKPLGTCPGAFLLVGGHKECLTVIIGELNCVCCLADDAKCLIFDVYNVSVRVELNEIPSWIAWNIPKCTILVGVLASVDDCLTCRLTIAITACVPDCVFKLVNVGELGGRGKDETELWTVHVDLLGVLSCLR